jgi:hypothetical protein
MAEGKTYIITTGDISDFDGFLTFPIYKKSGVDAVIFIMNYPAYFNYDNDNNTIYESLKNEKRLNDFMKLGDGLGYNYSYLDFEIFDSDFFRSNEISFDKGKFKELALKMCHIIWNEIEIDSSITKIPEFIFIDGGINELNPFSISSLANEFNLYYNIIKDYPLSLTFTEYNLIAFFNSLNINDNIYIDMNGSFAFYKDNNKNAIDSKIKNIKGFFIMGGVYNYDDVKTLKL